MTVKELKHKLALIDDELEIWMFVEDRQRCFRAGFEGPQVIQKDERGFLRKRGEFGANGEMKLVVLFE